MLIFQNVKLMWWRNNNNWVDVEDVEEEEEHINLVCIVIVQLVGQDYFVILNMIPVHLIIKHIMNVIMVQNV